MIGFSAKLYSIIVKQADYGSEPRSTRVPIISMAYLSYTNTTSIRIKLNTRITYLFPKVNINRTHTLYKNDSPLTNKQYQV